MHAIVPPYLLTRLAESSEPHLARAAQAARATLAVERDYKPRGRMTLSIGDDGSLVAEVTPAPDRSIWDAENREILPGTLVRTEDDPETGDAAADEAFDRLGSTFEFYWSAYARPSIDGAGGKLLATVHYGVDYDNAFWNGDRMVFGDGDGDVFTGFTRSLTVIAHELTHGVVDASGGLDYQGQSGALNESVADVFAALTEQFTEGQTAETATWLIGAEIFTDQVQGEALRSLKAPGTAYDDDVLGTDPQPAHMDDYVETDADQGGVHINSGIPNHAFYLVASALGGHAWERAGRIWYLTLTGGTLSEAPTFAEFAEAAIATAVSEYGEGSEEADAVRSGWAGVGVIEDVTPTEPAADPTGE